MWEAKRASRVLYDWLQNEQILFHATESFLPYISSIDTPTSRPPGESVAKLFQKNLKSNHFHALLQDPEGELADFMGYFQGNLAKAVNKIHKRKGKFWSREYDDVVVNGEEEFLNRYSYNAANPVAAGLVAKPSLWCGVSSVAFAKENRAIVGKGLDVTKYNEARRHGRKADRKKFEETFTFTLSTPPMLQEMSESDRNNYLSSLNDDAGRLARK